MGFNLGMFTDGHFYWDGSSRYFTRSNWSKVLLSEYVQQFGSIRIFCRCSIADFCQFPTGEVIESPKISFTRLPSFSGFRGYLSCRKILSKLIYEGLLDCGACLLRIPAQVSTVGCQVGKRLKKKTVCHIVGDGEQVLMSDPTILRNRFIRFIGSRVAYRRQLREVNSCDGQIAVSRELAKKYNCYSDEAGIIPNTTLVDQSFIPYRKRTATEPLNALFVGRIEYHKNVQLFLRALSLVRSKGLNVVSTVVGEGSYMGEIKSLTRKYNIGGVVNFVGRVDSRTKLLDYYRNGHIFYLLSFSEGLGISLLEAGAASLALIGSRRGGIPEVVQDRRNGFLIEPDDVEGCAAAISKLVLDEELRENMARESQLIVEPYTVKETVSRVAAVIDRLYCKEE